MKFKLTLLLPFFGITLITSFCAAQGPSTNMELNRAPLRYYSGVELTEFAVEAPTISNQIKYYFTESFTAKLIECEECAINTFDFYNQEVFNIAEHEDKRLVDSEVTFVYRDKYEITLLSRNEVIASIGITPEEVLELKIERPLPEWNGSGDDAADYALYKEELQAWILDFPEVYRALTSGTDLMKISKEEFLAASQSRRQAIQAHQGGYMIID